MKYDTVGNQIYEAIFNCDCGLTGGCEKCNPYIVDSFIGCITDEEAEDMRKKVNDFRKRFDEDIKRICLTT